jgi:hypothetical protein
MQMAYVRKTKVRRHSRKQGSGRDSYPADTEYYTYYQLVEGYRDDNGKVRQRMLAHLGRNETPEAALQNWSKWAAYYKTRAAEYRRAEELLRSGQLEGVRTSWSTDCYLAPRVGTEFDPNTAPRSRGFAPRGWFYVKEQTVGKGRESGEEFAAREAAEYEAKAAEYAERVERLRSALKNGSAPRATN